MRFRASDVARVVKGTLVGPDAEIRRVCVDSRLIVGGELFVPVLAARDGHDFVGHALVAGAAAYLTARPPAGGTAIVVPDTADALTALGRWARARLPDRVVAITGSTGKTSTKDLLGAALARRFRCGVSERSYNNELGVPLTLVNAPDGADAVVVEMGSRAVGHVAGLCELARPTVGVVTNVSPAHTATLGSLDGVARAKGELVAALPLDGAAVLNAGDPRVAAMASATPARVITFGAGQGDVAVHDVHLAADLRVSCRLETPWGTAQLNLNLRGAHHALNAAAAAAAALALGLPLEDVVAGLGEAEGSRWRMELGRARSGAVVLNDAYNANPASTEAALRSLVALPAERRFAVLGPMLELGALAEAEHARIGDLARSLGIDLVVAVGTDAYGSDPVDGADGAMAALGPVGPGDAVLVKASRAAGLERLAARLLTSEPGAAQAEPAQPAAAGPAWAGLPW